MAGKSVESRMSKAEGRKRSRTSTLAARLRRVRLLLCDVDGVLTDAGIFISGDAETKRFNIRDGLGLRLLQRCRLRVGWISNRPSPATTRRAEELKIDFLCQNSDGDKVAAVEEILGQTGLSWSELCYVGDDVVDLGVLKRAGCAVAVADAIAEARSRADYVTKASGGHGAVREVVELILKAQGKWRQLIEEYSA